MMPVVTNGLLIVHYARDAVFNMAFDEWLLGVAAVTPGSVFLRLYSWMPGAISFGFHQDATRALDWDRVGETPVIRRLTGGRALYHDPAELTYSLVWNHCQPPAHPLGRARSESTAAIAAGLVKFARDLGFPADYVRTSPGDQARPSYFHKAPCFASAARYEVVCNGRKLVASAARRLPTATLQHGAIKLDMTVPHPALAHSEIAQVNSPEELSAVSPGVFLARVSVMVAAMSEVLLLNLLRCEPGWGAENGLKNVAEYVKKSPLGQRECIEQKGVSSSL